MCERDIDLIFTPTLTSLLTSFQLKTCAQTGGSTRVHSRVKGGGRDPGLHRREGSQRFRPSFCCRESRIVGTHLFPRCNVFVKLEEAKSGRAKCKACQDLIGAGELRVGVETFAGGRFVEERLTVSGGKFVVAC